MNKPFKIYYNAEGQITSMTTQEIEGKYVVVTAEQFDQVQQKISQYQIVDNELVNIKKVRLKPATLKFSNDFDLAKSNECYMVQKNNLFLCEQSVTIKPKDFDNTKYSWVKYDS